jgi:hypothetical protein
MVIEALELVTLAFWIHAFTALGLRMVLHD